MANQGIEISIIIPFYNEKAHLSHTVDGIVRLMSDNTSYEILLIDSGSTDGSLDIALSLEKKYTRVNTHSLGRKMNASEVVAEGKVLPSFKELGKMILLFLLIMLTDIFFRANNVVEAFDYFGKIFSGSLFDFPSILMGSNSLITLGLILLFVAVEWIHRGKKHDFELSTYPVWIRWSSYVFIFVLLLFFGKSAETFIYFQF